MISTSLNKILACNPCLSGWNKLVGGLNKPQFIGKNYTFPGSTDDEVLPLFEIVRINGIEDALWATKTAPEYKKEWSLFAIFCTRQVQHLILDDRATHALDVAERYAHGKASHSELERVEIDAWTVLLSTTKDTAASSAASAMRTAVHFSERMWLVDVATFALDAAARAACTNDTHFDAAYEARMAAKVIQKQEFLRIVG